MNRHRTGTSLARRGVRGLAEAWPNASEIRTLRTLAFAISMACAGAGLARGHRVTSNGIVVGAMRALLLEPDPAWLEDRRRKGLDRFDEVWDGVLHVVPFPTADHQRIERELERVLIPIARSFGLEVFHNFGIYSSRDSDMDYRGPDVMVVDPANVSRRGVEARAELVVEILSPNDESREKMPFYAKCGIPELWILDPTTREIEVFVLQEGTYTPQPPGPDGWIEAPRLGLRLRVVDGRRLAITCESGNFEI